MAIGDNFNDLEMLNFAGRSIVMANSAPDLIQTAQERGWEITATNDEDGVAQVIESILETAGVQYGERLSH
jgi:hydroxymethylpyrimidine pyrophosphatase-like HAD family hydrolase